MKICPECKTQYESGKFCPECGTGLVEENEYKCPSCGAEIDPNAKFCSECGAKIGGAAKERSKAEEKELSVEMVPVKGGTLTLGSDEQDYNQEHDVKLDDFYMAKYEVTQQLYKDVMGENPSGFKGPKRPVENVSWYDAVEFCNELSKRDGLDPCYKIDKRHEDPDNEEDLFDDVKWTVRCDWKASGYRLPTEAEWEYAARGGQETEETEYAGSDDADDVAWYDDNSDGQTHAVGRKKPNELDLYDMSGNVWEWCWDWYAKDYMEDGLKNPRGASSGSFRCVRGGSWSFGAFYCAVAYRFRGDADSRNNRLGFRVCRSSSK